jgi:hypothetical protein
MLIGSGRNASVMRPNLKGQAILAANCVIVFICTIFTCELAHSAQPREQDKIESSYEDTLDKVLKRVDQQIRKNKFSDKLNTSLRPTVAAGLILVQNGDLKTAKKIVTDALEIDASNPLAYLIDGDLNAALGRKDLAGRSYADFWKYAEREHVFLRAVLKSEDQKIIASHISAKLFLYGIDFPDKELPHDLPLQMELPLEKRSLPNILVVFGLPILVAAGIPFFIYRRFLSLDISFEVDRILYRTYGVLLLSYLLWIAHQFWGLKPFWGNAELEVLRVLACGLGAVGILHFAGQWINREKERHDPTTIFCAHCGKSILKIAIVCPFCNEAVRKT